MPGPVLDAHAVYVNKTQKSMLDLEIRNMDMWKHEILFYCYFIRFLIIQIICEYVLSVKI